MADDALQQLVGTTTAMDALLDKLRLQQETYTFTAEETDEAKRRSLLWSPYFEEYFLDFIKETLTDFEHNTTGVLPFRLDILEPFTKHEQVSKQKLREFFNLLVKKMVERDKLGTLIPELKKFPEFIVGSLPETTETDSNAIEYFRNYLIPQLEKLHQGLIEKTEEEKKEPEKKKEDAPKQEKSTKQDEDHDGFDIRRKRVQQQATSYEQQQAQAGQDSSPTTIEGKKLFYQESVRDSFYLLDPILNSCLDVDDWNTYLHSLPQAQQLEANFEIQEIRGRLQSAIVQYLESDPELALLLSTVDRVSVAERTKILAKLSRKIDLITQTLAQDGVFRSYTLDLKEKLHIGKNKQEYKPSEVVVSETTTQAVKEIETKEAKNNYSEVAKKQFKEELKHILALSTLQEGHTIEQIADNILDYYPKIRSLDELKNLNLSQFMPSTLFSVNQEEHDFILKEVSEVIQDKFANRIKPFTPEEKNEFKQLFEAAVVAGVAKQNKIDTVVNRIFEEFDKTELLSQVNEETLARALPDDFFNLPPEGQQKVRDYVLTFFKTGKIQHISSANFKSFQKATQAKGQSLQNDLRSTLAAYGLEGLDGKDARSSQLIQILDSYALSNVSASDLEKNIGALLKEIHPNLLQNKELKEFLIQYVNDRKLQFAQYTQNQIATHSTQHVDPGQITSHVIHTDTLIKQYGSDVVAHAYFTRDLANLDGIEDSQEIETRKRAWEVRQLLIEFQREEFKKWDAQQKEAYAASLGIDRSAFLAANAQNEQTFDERAYEDSIINASNPWGAPDTTALNASSLAGIRNYLGGLQNAKALTSPSLKAFSTKILSSQGKKVAVAGLAGTGAGLAIYGAITNLVQGTIGTTLGGAAGGAAFGAAVGSVIPGVGTLAGGATGAVVGGIAGFVTGINGGGTQVSLAMGKASVGTKTALSNFARPATANATNFASTLPEVFTGSTATIPASTTVVAVGAPLLAVSSLTLITISSVVGAFLPDASSTQVAPYFSLDLNQSRYIALTKESSPSNSSTPTEIKYSITLAKKEDAVEDLVITRLEDTMKVIDKNSAPVDPPALPQEALDFFTSLEGTTITTTPITFEFTVDATDPRFTDTLITNDIKVIFTQNGTEETSISRALSCIGDCPKVTVPPCWPSDGGVTQLPRALGGPISLGNNQLSPKTSSHARFNAQLPNDAYDIGAGILEDKFPPIYAVADGVVLFAGWYGTKADPSSIIKDRKDLLLDWNYGNLTIIDHGTFVSYYAHQSQIDVQAGQQVAGGDKIGMVGSTGYSSGNHLHYEVRGFSEYVLFPTLKIDLTSPPTRVGPLCNTYYGK